MEFFENFLKNFIVILIVVSIILLSMLLTIFVVDEVLPPIRQTDYDMAMIVDAGIVKKNILWYSIDGEWVYICSRDEALGEMIYRVHESNVVLIKTEATWD